MRTAESVTQMQDLSEAPESCTACEIDDARFVFERGDPALCGTDDARFVLGVVGHI